MKNYITILSQQLQAFLDRDEETLMRVWQDFFQPGIFLEVLNASLQERKIFKEIFETNDSILCNWWLHPNESQEYWRQLMLPNAAGDFSFSMLIMNALWLRLVDSDILIKALPSVDQLIEHLQTSTYAQKAKALAYFCFHCDAQTPLDYAKIFALLPHTLKTFWIYWFLKVYLFSPFSFLQEEVQINRQNAIKDFIKIHSSEKWHIPCDPALNLVSYRASYSPVNQKDFIEVLYNSILIPSLENKLHISAQYYFSQTKKSSEIKYGVILSQWHENHVIYRCIEPLLAELDKKNIVAIVLGNECKNLKKIPENWKKPPINLFIYENLNSFEEWAELIQQLRAFELDFLFFPEIGLTQYSRWLSLFRIAKIQATTYGHPYTSGSKQIDYFIGGADIEYKTENQYTEKLEILPGLGIVSHSPPIIEKSRRTRVYDYPEELCIFNLSSMDKLNSTLLQTWNKIFEDLSQLTILHLFPAIPEGRILAEYPLFAPYFTNIEVRVHPTIMRQELLNLLVEADVYLDSYPFGGYNTIIEVLASGCPMVTWAGDAAKNRFGAAILQRLEMPDWLIAHDSQSYIAAAKRLILDVDTRLEIRNKLTREFVLERLCDDSKIASYFKAWVERVCCVIS